MSVATISKGAGRTAIMAWRDEATLGAMALVHGAAVEAMAALDRRVDTITMAEAMTGTDAVARRIVRPLMREAVGATADRWFTDQARALRQVDGRLEPLALRFAATSERPILPPDDVPSRERWTAPGWLRGVDSAIDRAASRTLPDAVRQAAEWASARIGRELGERSGAHDRVRNAGRDELARRWLGPASGEASVRPYLTQLLDLVDATTRDAKETMP